MHSINFDFQRGFILEGDPRRVPERVGRGQILVPLHHPLSVVHGIAQLQKTEKKIIHLQNPRQRSSPKSYLFTIHDARHFLHARGPRRVVLGLPQGEPVRAHRGRYENFLLRRAHAADQVHQTVGVQHVEQAHQPGWMEGLVGLVVVPQVVSGHREQIHVPGTQISIVLNVAYILHA